MSSYAAELDPMPLSPLGRGSRISTAKRHPNGVPARRRVPLRVCATDGESRGDRLESWVRVRRRPAASGGRVRGGARASETRPASIQPRPAASDRVLIAGSPGRLREVILAALCGAFIFAICSTALAGGRRRQRSRQAWASSSVPARQIASDSFHRPKTPAYTVASSHASALPTSRAHRSTCVQKNPRAKP